VPNDPSDQGTEVFLSLVDLLREPAVLAGWTLDVQTTCLSRDLPARLPFGGGQPPLHLSQGSGLVTRLMCLTAPTRTLRPPRRDQAHWRLISHLALGHLPIVPDQDGAEALREMLRLYDFQDSSESRALIDALVSVSSRRGTARIPGEIAGGFCRGLEVELELDPRLLSGNESYLFACVLEAFLGLYVSMNSYSRLALKYKGREGIVRQWRPRAGERFLS
jgi:type VI secretion system protein ImpG